MKLVPRAEAASKRFSLGWLIWTVALLAIAWVTVGTELDFATQRRPQLADSVPGMFSNFAQAVDARNALLASDGPATEKKAAKLLSRRPIPAENLSLLASALILQKNEQAGPVLQAGVTRGWRDMLMQLAALDGALQTQNWDVAIQRLTALRTMRRPKEYIDPIVQQIVQNPDGRQAYAAFLKGNPTETKGFIRSGLGFLDSDSYSNVILMALQSGASFECEQLSDAATRLLRANAGKNARQVWPERCDGGSETLSNVATFAQNDGKSNPFDWQYPAEPGLMRDYSKGDALTTLKFNNTDSLKRILSKRYLTLSSGSHQIILKDAQGMEVKDIDVLLSCRGKGVRAAVSNPRYGLWDVNLPNEGCSVQLLQLRVPQGRGEIAQVLVQ